MFYICHAFLIKNKSKIDQNDARGKLGGGL